MSAPNTTDHEIPLTDRHWRERWAQELTRANALERELNQARAARDAALQTCDDITAICESQARRIGFLDLNIETEKQTAEFWKRRAQANFARADKLAEWIEEGQPDRSDLELLLERGVGVDCPECEGSGRIETFDDVMVGGSHSTRDYTVECEAKGCVGGKVLR